MKRSATYRLRDHGRGLTRLLAGITVALVATVGMVVPSAQAAEVAPVTVVAHEADWAYFNDSPQNYPGDDWYENGYNDTSWNIGQAPLGYSNSMIKSTLSYGDNSSSKWPVYLFRKSVNLTEADLAQRDEVKLSMKIDDSALIFINGERVQTLRYTKSPVDFQSYSGLLGANGSTDEATLSLDASKLKLGENVIAVAVFQESGTSSDVVFDLGITLQQEIYTEEDYAPSQITVSFNGDTKTRKGIAWQTAKNSPSDVRYLASENEPTSFEAALTASGSTVPTDVLGGFTHKTLLEGLTPDTSYWYQVGDASRDIWSAPARLTTANDDGVVSFSVLADSQGGNENDYVVSAKTFAKARQLDDDSDFMLQLGDLVDNSNSADQWRWLHEKAQSTWSNNTFITMAGNHDTATNTYFNHYHVPRVAEQTDGAYYSVDYDNVHISVLNTNDIVNNRLGQAQVDWLKTDLEQAKQNGAKWLIVGLHKSTQSVANHIADGDVIGMRQQLQPIYDEYDVDIVLAGHDHTYVRTVQLGASEPVEGTQLVTRDGIETAINPDGTVHLLPNSTGNKFYSPKSASEIAANKVYPAKYGQNNLQMFSNFEVTDTRLTFETYEFNQSANTLTNYDSYSIIKDGEVGEATTPATVSNLKVTDVTGSTARVSWALPTDDGGTEITGYRVRVSAEGNVISEELVNDQTVELSGLAGKTAHSVEVVAVNEQGSGASAVAEFDTPSAKADSPEQLEASDVTASDAKLSWAAPARDGGEPITGYSVTIKRGAETVSTQTVTETSFTATGLQPGVEYTATVRAINSVGSGEPQHTSWRTDAADAPSNVRIADVSSSSVRVTWTPPVYQSQGIGAYEVLVSRGGEVVKTELVWSSAATSAVISGLSAATKYDFQVRYQSFLGSSPVSASVSHTTAQKPAVVVTAKPKIKVTALKKKKARITVSVPGVKSFSGKVSVRVQGVKGTKSVTVKNGKATISLGKQAKPGKQTKVTVKVLAKSFKLTGKTIKVPATSKAVKVRAKK